QTGIGIITAADARPDQQGDARALVEVGHTLRLGRADQPQAGRRQRCDHQGGEDPFKFRPACSFVSPHPDCLAFSRNIFESQFGAQDGGGNTSETTACDSEVRLSLSVPVQSASGLRSTSACAVFPARWWNVGSGCTTSPRARISLSARWSVSTSGAASTNCARSASCRRKSPPPG